MHSVAAYNPMAPRSTASSWQHRQYTLAAQQAVCSRLAAKESKEAPLRCRGLHHNGGWPLLLPLLLRCRGTIRHHDAWPRVVVVDGSRHGGSALHGGPGYHAAVDLADHSRGGAAGDLGGWAVELAAKQGGHAAGDAGWEGQPAGQLFAGARLDGCVRHASLLAVRLHPQRPVPAHEGAVDGAVQVVNRARDAVLLLHQALDALGCLLARGQDEGLERVNDLVGVEVVDGDRRGAHARPEARSSPERLVTEEGDNEGGLACIQAGGSGARPSMVHHRAALVKQPVMGRAVDEQHVLRV
mmetsp:Transcript_39814/g.88505  ORF Transcript_39814/g.88505 Transcript_39814/m.88505 type:complete len:298 (-) Transcript_39814:3087-3980(-)